MQISGHSSVDVLWVSVMTKVFMIGKEDEFVFGPLYQMSVVFQPFYHGQEFSIPDIIVSFGFSQSRKVVGDRSSSPFFVLLKKHSSYGKLGAVHLQFELFFEVGMI